MVKNYIRRGETVEMSGSAGSCTFMATPASLTWIGIDKAGMPGAIMLSLAVWSRISCGNVTVWWQIVAGDTAGGIVHWIGDMAC